MYIIIMKLSPERINIGIELLIENTNQFFLLFNFLTGEIISLV